jgi:hypothetical protein
MNVDTLFMKKIRTILLLRETKTISEEAAKDQIDWAINAYELHNYAMALNSFTDEVSGQMEGFSEMETSKEANKRIIDFIKKFKELSHNLIQTELAFDEIREESEEWQ